MIYWEILLGEKTHTLPLKSDNVLENNLESLQNNIKKNIHIYSNLKNNL